MIFKFTVVRVKFVTCLQHVNHLTKSGLMRVAIPEMLIVLQSDVLFACSACVPGAFSVCVLEEIHHAGFLKRKCVSTLACLSQEAAILKLCVFHPGMAMGSGKRSLYSTSSGRETPRAFGASRDESALSKVFCFLVQEWR